MNGVPIYAAIAAAVLIAWTASLSSRMAAAFIRIAAIEHEVGEVSANSARIAGLTARIDALSRDVDRLEMAGYSNPGEYLRHEFDHRYGGPR